MPRENAFWYLSLIFMIQFTRGLDCIDWINYPGGQFFGSQLQVIESAHPYCANVDIAQQYSFFYDGPTPLMLSFDDQSYIESESDYLLISWTDSSGALVSRSFSGGDLGQLEIDADSFTLSFQSDSTVEYFGYKISIVPQNRCAEFIVNDGETFNDLSVQTIESPHPYCNLLNVTQRYAFTHSSVETIFISFDNGTKIEEGDGLQFIYDDIATGADGVTISLTGENFIDFVMNATDFELKFTSDDAITQEGYRFIADPRPCAQFAHQAGSSFETAGSAVIESPHNYCDDLLVTQHYEFNYPSVTALNFQFDEISHIENGWDLLTITFSNFDGNLVTKSFTGVGFQSFTAATNSFDLTFTSDSSSNYYGYKFTVTQQIDDTLNRREAYTSFQAYLKWKKSLLEKKEKF